MPFGGNCEYGSFAACVGAIRRKKRLSADRARAYCGELQRRTEEHCANRRKVQASGETRLVCPEEVAQIEAELDREFGVVTGGG